MSRVYAVVTCMAVFFSSVAVAQSGIRGQIFLPNGSPPQRQIRFTLTTDNGLRNEIFFTDSNGRIAMPQINTPYTITVESDGETYETTRVSFIPPHSGPYIIIGLNPLRNSRPSAPGTIEADAVDENVSPKARESYADALKLLQSEQYEKAIEPLKRAISIQGDYFHAHNDLGVVYMKLNRLDEAADSFRRAIKINGKRYLPQLNLGIVLNRQRKFKEAADVLGHLQSNHPGVTALHLPLIEALIEAQQWPRAEQEIARALSIKELDQIDLKIKQGMVMIRQGKFDGAAAVLAEAAEAEPNNALAQFNLGVALMQSGMLERAEAALRRAYEIEGPRMGGVHLLLGQIYFQKKDYSKAIESFETYLRDSPDAPNAAQVKEAIQKLKQALK